MLDRNAPLIFNAYIQEDIDVIRDRTHLGIKINEYRVDKLRFADNIAIIVDSENGSKTFFMNNGTGNG